MLEQNAGAMTGARFIASLDDGREVWLNGERVKSVANHPAFSGMAREFARLYDLQHDAANGPRMTFDPAGDGKRYSISYLRPQSAEDLKLKAENARTWAQQVMGILARPPEYMANVVVGLYDYSSELDASTAGFGAHARDYHQFAMDADLLLTHAIGDPQIDRSASPLQDPDLALRIVRETDDGIVVRGAKQLATTAPFAHEVLIYLSSTFALREAREFIMWFAAPMNSPGLKILCREPLCGQPYGHGHPLASRFDEQDAMLFFDDVTIPWHRVFLLYDGMVALRGLPRLNTWSSYGGMIRYHERLKTYLAVSSMMADSIGVSDFRGIQEDLGELATYVELTRQLILGAESEAHVTPGGLYAPGQTRAAGIFAAQIFSRVAEITRRIGASGIIMRPSEADLSGELGPFIQRYMRGRGIDASKKSRLFRLAWDLVADGFAQRGEMYEYLHRGDIARNRISLGKAYDITEAKARIEQMISVP